ncbi:hypothetical protein AGLY_012351 [Aphis glycines]|uniref:Uncharacterized protein n=1 Tax=Aphis glycines TaxID=307491 RepID=A0A6G0TA05_APHGL|nr:hypothetical protein AGLY_012351 [Aphis glycines]
MLSFLANSLIIGKWIPLCCTLGGGVDLGLGIYDLYYLNNNKYQKSFEAKPLFNAVLEPCTKFSKLSYTRKNVYDFPTTKLLANFRNFDIFQQLLRNLVLNFQDFLVSQKIFIFLSYSKIKNSILTKTEGLKSKIEAFLLLQMLSTDTKKKTHVIVKSIHSSLRSESKITPTWRSAMSVTTFLSFLCHILSHQLPSPTHK